MNILNKEEQSLNEMVQESIDALESKSVQRNVKIYFDEKETVILNHDQLWLEEALINIIKNGIELNENPIYKRIIIEDSGEGISDIEEK